MICHLKNKKKNAVQIRRTASHPEKKMKRDRLLSAALPSLGKGAISEKEAQNIAALYMGWFNW